MISNDLALIYGILLGDGCLSRSGKGYFISITCNYYSDLPLIFYLQPKLEKLSGKRVNPRLRKKYGKVEINFSDKNLFSKFKEIGFPIGKKGIGLEISQDMKKYLKYVIKGYFATDGCLALTNNNGTLYPRLEFSSISITLLTQVKNYLFSQGIKGNVYLSKSYQNGHNNLFRLQINGKTNLINFYTTIGFINQKHEEKFMDYLGRYFSKKLPAHQSFKKFF